MNPAVNDGQIYFRSPSAKPRPRPQGSEAFITWSVMQPASRRFGWNWAALEKRRGIEGTMRAALFRGRENK